MKRNRQPLPDSEYFAMRGTSVKWPTLRGAYLTPDTVKELRKYAFGVIFLEGEYKTRLNYGNIGPYTLDEQGTEYSCFFEHLHKVDGAHIFLLIWVGNYYRGSIFHCAWQFPQMANWDWNSLERAAFESYHKVATILYRDVPYDREVANFLLNGIEKRNP